MKSTLLNFLRHARALALGFSLCCASDGLLAAGLRFSPPVVSIASPEASQQLLISDIGSAANSIDLTRLATYEVRPANLARVDERGLVHPLADGMGEIHVRHAGAELRIPLSVSGFQSPPPVSYQNDITAILTKARCNSGGCHGKAEGQNGFKLSIFGFDTLSDHAALVKESRGRRVTVARPASSLLYLKGSARVPHGGGRKIEPESYHDRLLLRWIAEGARYDSEEESASQRIVGIRIEPQQQTLLASGTQQLRVLAVDESGAERCVTADADFESNAASIADVDERGLIEASDIPGEAAILVRYLGHVAVCRVTLPRPGVTFARPAENNFIDKHVWDKLAGLGIEPSELADDAAFLRRASLDTIGTLPSPEEVRAFLADADPDKRAKLVDRLLARPEYADYWAMKWLDILRADQLQTSSQGAVAMQRWLRRQFEENRPR